MKTLVPGSDHQDVFDVPRRRLGKVQFKAFDSLVRFRQRLNPPRPWPGISPVADDSGLHLEGRSSSLHVN